MKKKNDRFLELARLLGELPDCSLKPVSDKFPELGPERFKELILRLAEVLVSLSENPGSAKKRVEDPPSACNSDPSKMAVLRIDGASRGNPGPAAAAAIIETTEGQTVDEAGLSLGWQTNNHAEYRALILGLEKALMLGFGGLEVYSDSQLLVRQMLGEYKVRHPEIARLKEEADRLVGGFSHVGFHHVPREQNSKADALANKVLDGRYRPSTG